MVGLKVKTCQRPAHGPPECSRHSERVDLIGLYVCNRPAHADLLDDYGEFLATRRGELLAVVQSSDLRLGRKNARASAQGASKGTSADLVDSSHHHEALGSQACLEFVERLEAGRLFLDDAFSCPGRS
jgi:hypothetical protein